MTNSIQKIAAVNSYMEAFAKADINIIKEIYAEDAVVEDPVGAEPLNGIEAICKFYQSAFDMGAKLTLHGEVRCAGNTAAFMFTVEAAGMKISPIDVFEFDKAGKVVSMKAYWGPENVLA